MERLHARLVGLCQPLDNDIADNKVKHGEIQSLVILLRELPLGMDLAHSPYPARELSPHASLLSPQLRNICSLPSLECP